MSNLVDTLINHHQYIPMQPNCVQYMASGGRFGEVNCAYSAPSACMQYEPNPSVLQMNQSVSSMMPFKLKNNASPIIQLIPCASEEEDISDYSSIVCDGSSTAKARMNTKLNYNSKAFIVNKLANKDCALRKTSQVTKSCSDEEGNSTDSSEDFSPNSYYARKHSKITSIHIPDFDEDATFSTSDEKALQVKFKTELCKNWQAGNCKFGNKCSFAHGENELAEKRHLPSNYKTKICKQFHEEMYCSYGSRCQFIHLEEASISQEGALTKAICATAGVRPARKQRQRLTVFAQLAD